MKVLGLYLLDFLPFIVTIGFSTSMIPDKKGLVSILSIISLIALSIGFYNIQIDNYRDISSIISKIRVSDGFISGFVTFSVYHYLNRSKFGAILMPYIIIVVSFLMGGLVGILNNIAFVTLSELSNFIYRMGFLGAFFYALILRILYLFGIHHIFYILFWITPLGGTVVFLDENISGWVLIFLRQLADNSPFIETIAFYNSGRYLHFVFGLPITCLALYHSIPKKQRSKDIAQQYCKIGANCFLFGLSEPITAMLYKKSSLFVYLEILFYASSMALAQIFSITIGALASVGVIDLFIYGVLQNNERTKVFELLILGILLSLLYYGVYRFCIYKFKIDLSQDIVSSELTQQEQAELIIRVLGGWENITSLNNCATRLRVVLKDPSKVLYDQIEHTKAYNYIVRGSALQIIYGKEVQVIKSCIDNIRNIIK